MLAVRDLVVVHGDEEREEEKSERWANLQNN
jgi:hypothetical protein